MKTYNVNTINHDEYITPKYIIDALGPFDLDPCSPIIPPYKIAENIFTKEDDSLNKDWEGRVWLNPPYGRETFKFVRKLAGHCNGIALIAARTETIGFQDFVFPMADSLFFIRGRLKFLNVKGEELGPAGFPSVLVSYGRNNTEIIANAVYNGRIKGHFAFLNYYWKQEYSKYKKEVMTEWV